MLTNGVTEIVLVNRSWMGLFGERIDPSASDAVAHYYGELFAALAHDGALGIDSQCGLLLTLMQEAVIRDDDRLAALPDDHARDWSSLVVGGADHRLLAARALRRS